MTKMSERVVRLDGVKDLALLRVDGAGAARVREITPAMLEGRAFRLAPAAAGAIADVPNGRSIDVAWAADLTFAYDVDSHGHESALRIVDALITQLELAHE